jgi:hypothetical protein
MPQALMPNALWLGLREYAGIWRYGGGVGNFGVDEELGDLADA